MLIALLSYPSPTEAKPSGQSHEDGGQTNRRTAQRLVRSGWGRCSVAAVGGNDPARWCHREAVVVEKLE
jgi:hypothetical protein